MKNGHHKIIFPLGYKGDQIKKYVKNNVKFGNFDFTFVETGIDKLIKHRINDISHLLPENEDFLLIHADYLCFFEYKKFINAHNLRADNCVLTMMTFLTNQPKNCGVVEIDKNNVVINAETNGTPTPTY